jgi:hypothetical protein
MLLEVFYHNFIKKIVKKNAKISLNYKILLKY